MKPLFQLKMILTALLTATAMTACDQADDEAAGLASGDNSNSGKKADDLASGGGRVFFRASCAGMMEDFEGGGLLGKGSLTITRESTGTVVEFVDDSQKEEFGITKVAKYRAFINSLTTTFPNKESGPLESKMTFTADLQGQTCFDPEGTQLVEEPNGDRFHNCNKIELISPDSSSPDAILVTFAKRENTVTGSVLMKCTFENRPEVDICSDLKAKYGDAACKLADASAAQQQQVFLRASCAGTMEEYEGGALAGKGSIVITREPSGIVANFFDSEVGAAEFGLTKVGSYKAFVNSLTTTAGTAAGDAQAIGMEFTADVQSQTCFDPQGNQLVEEPNGDKWHTCQKIEKISPDVSSPDSILVTFAKRDNTVMGSVLMKCTFEKHPEVDICSVLKSKYGDAACKQM